MQIGSSLPLISLPDIYGNKWDSTSTTGKIFIINFWSAECPWSKTVDEQLLPHLNAWEDQLSYAAVAANTHEPLELLQTTAQARHIPRVLLDENQAFADQLGALSTPHFFVFNGEGNLRYQGGFDDTSFRKREASRFYLVEAVNALLAGGKPAVQEAPPFGCTIVRFSPTKD